MLQVVATSQTNSRTELSSQQAATAVASDGASRQFGALITMNVDSPVRSGAMEDGDVEDFGDFSSLGGVSGQQQQQQQRQGDHEEDEDDEEEDEEDEVSGSRWSLHS